MEQIFRIVERKRAERLERNILTRLHINMCQAANGWIPLEEFMNLPAPYVFNFLHTYQEMMDELERKQKVRKLAKV